MFSSPCGYFDNQTALMTVYSMPSEQEAHTQFSAAYPELQDMQISFQQLMYDVMLEQGFRRSDSMVYRNDCPDCKQCIPIRLDVTQFKPSKSQRHVLNKNIDVTLNITKDPDTFVTPDKILLYRSYYQWHNPGKVISFEQAKDELQGIHGISEKAPHTTNYSGTINMEYYLDTTLIGCSIVDVTPDSISSNYFYWDISTPIQKRSIGTYSILQEIRYCQQHNLKWYYLGYYIAACDAMKYKGNFKPHQLRINDTWQEQHS